MVATEKLEIFMPEKKKLALIIHSGTIDKLLCAFTLGSTAAAMTWKCIYTSLSGDSTR